MASKRMFSKTITSSAKFIKMPAETQALYFHLCMNADDDGVCEAFSIMRLIGSTEDSIRILHAKGFVRILNDDLVTLITDWNEHNLIRPDRKVDSIYKTLLLQIAPDVQLVEPKPRADTGKPTGMDGQWTDNGPHRLGKDRLGKDRKEEVSKNEIPFFENQLLNEAFKIFLKDRKERGKSPTERAIKMLITELNELSADPETQMKIINQSIKKSYTSFYPLKTNDGKNTG